MFLEFEFAFCMTAGDGGQHGTGFWVDACIQGSIGVHEDKQTLVERPKSTGSCHPHYLHTGKLRARKDTPKIPVVG